MPIGNMPPVERAACGMVIDRHVPKTAGTTVRSLLRRNQQLGCCEYMGYDVGRTWQSRVGFTHKSLTELRSELQWPASPRRICMEAHMVNGDFWSDIAAIRASHFVVSPHLKCTLVVVVRVREPLSWYRSYYDWAVLSRQRTGHVKVWGANFTDWLPPNMQCRFLLHGAFGQGSEWAAEMAKASRGMPRQLSAERWDALERFVRSADVAAPLDRLDDSLRLVRHMSGFLNTTKYVTTKPQPMHGPWERLPRLAKVESAARFCDNAGVDCAAAVRAAAPDDHRLYTLVTRLFEASWRRHLDQIGSSIANGAHVQMQHASAERERRRYAASGHGRGRGLYRRRAGRNRTPGAHDEVRSDSSRPRASW